MLESSFAKAWDNDEDAAYDEPDSRVFSVASREQNERKFRHWQELPNGGRIYWYYAPGRHRGYARYVKEVDQQETTIRFWQEVFDDQHQQIAIHHKFPIDLGHEKR